jgi:hypothetical protein
MAPLKSGSHVAPYDYVLEHTISTTEIDATVSC